MCTDEEREEHEKRLISLKQQQYDHEHPNVDSQLQLLFNDNRPNGGGFECLHVTWIRNDYNPDIMLFQGYVTRVVSPDGNEHKSPVMSVETKRDDLSGLINNGLMNEAMLQHLYPILLKEEEQMIGPDNTLLLIAKLWTRESWEDVKQLCQRRGVFLTRSTSYLIYCASLLKEFGEPFKINSNLLDCFFWCKVVDLKERKAHGSFDDYRVIQHIIRVDEDFIVQAINEVKCVLSKFLIEDIVNWVLLDYMHYKSIKSYYKDNVELQPTEIETDV
jgi:hypothetical protein